MNLYAINPRYEEWCCYVFAKTGNKAKAMLVGYFTYEVDDEYLDYRYWTVKKNVDGLAEVCDVDCERLKKLGVEYLEESYLELE